MKSILEKINSQFDRLDAADSETNSSGICVSDVDHLPYGWVQVYDGTVSVYGPAAEILAALESVEYDRSATREEDDEFSVCVDPDCPQWRGHQPESGHEFEHGHTTTRTVKRDNGWELAWESLADFSDEEPTNSKEWPSDLITFKQLEFGTANDNPNTLITVKTNAGKRYAAGPHGVSCCALSDWIDSVGDLAETSEAAITTGVSAE